MPAWLREGGGSSWRDVERAGLERASRLYAIPTELGCSCLCFVAAQCGVHRCTVVIVASIVSMSHEAVMPLSSSCPSWKVSAAELTEAGAPEGTRFSIFPVVCQN